ncbi:MAG: PKD domain-containing protein [Bryobacterales bacterium]|nr:PKD domain-containing protein [Bryobacterales bacterium]
MHTLSRVALVCLLSFLARPALSQEAKFVYGCEPRANWCSELTCTFDGSSSTSPNGPILGYSWYLRRYLAEDRESETTLRTGVRVNHTYTNVRCRSYTYFATLEVTDALGNKNLHTERVDSSRRLDLPPENQRPSADFVVHCNHLQCSFDASASSDPDGTLVGYLWDFGDGNSGNGITSFHTYESAGSYSVRLTVADNEGATATRLRAVSVVAPGFSLSISGYLSRGLQKASLRWTGATSDRIDLYRNGVSVASVPNTGSHIDNIDLRGRGTYTHRVCEQNTSICSNETSISFD